MDSQDLMPRDDARRLAAFRTLGNAGCARDDVFDALAETAAALCETPIAHVVLVDEHRQWFVGSVGMPNIGEAKGQCTFSTRVTATGRPLLVPDASLDARFADQWLVTGPHNMQFYAGEPVHYGRDVTLGSLCVVDHVPRELEPHQLEGLRLLADIATRELASRATAPRNFDGAHDPSGHAFLQRTLDAIADGVLSTDTAGRVRWMNPAAERATGWSTIDAVGRPLADVFTILDEATRTVVPDPIDALLGDRAPLPTAAQPLLVARDGRESAIDCSVSPIRDGDDAVIGAVVTFRDVSEQRRLHAGTGPRATHDALTGLPNRAAFEAILADRLADVGDGIASPALLHLDLDHFKFVNDVSGHAAGDQLLRQIGGIVRSCVRADDVLARLGGDEFGLLLAQCDVPHAHTIAQTICDRLEAFRFVHHGRRFRIGASIGLVTLQAPWPNATALLQAADASCFAARQEGRNRVHVWQPTDTALATRQDEMQWVGRIELALDEECFVLQGQRIEPIATGSDGLHFEVLLRMREADGTLTSPGAFLPIAERFHLATRIDRWVVGKAFEEMTEAARGGVAIAMMAINLSGQTLCDRTFHRDLVAMIRGAAFDVNRLCLEITETAAITHLSDARAFIDEVRALGVKVALDDFGAGTSSFGYLKSFQVDYLKIDGHFITHLLDDPIDYAAVRCFCEIAQVMGIRTIAEFVEDEAVRDALRTIGVDLAQGYLIHVPEPLADLLADASPRGRPMPAIGTGRPSTTRERHATGIAVAPPHADRLDIGDPAEVLLWADDLSITAERLQEIVAKVGPMRAAIRFYVMAQRRTAGQLAEGPREEGGTR